MSENAYSLPPEIKGKAHGKLRVQIGKIQWLDQSIASEGIHFRIKF